MKLIPVGSFGFAVLVSTVLVMGATEGRAHAEAAWQAYELPVDGHYYRGEINAREDGPLGRGISVHGREMVFMAHVMPGKAYTLGLRMPNKGRLRLAVSLYDRWPYESDAKSWRLQTGSALMSNRKHIEYQWRISTDPASTGNLLFMKVNVERPAKARRYRYPVYAFIVTPPVEPMRELGRGVTHLRGPSNLVLQTQAEQVHIIRAIVPVESWDGPDEEVRNDINGLIPNGNFRDGLSRWKVFPGYHDTGEIGVSVGRHGLRLWGEKESRLAGVEQTFDSPIIIKQGDRLVMDIRIRRQAQRDGFASLDDFPLRLDIFCQPGSGHQGYNIYSRAFSVSAVKNKVLRKRVVKVPLNRWFHFESFPSGRSGPACRAKRIRLAGGGMPERNVWIRQVGVGNRKE
jgi:hypothetical protein